jgi:hypothetical protein
MIYSDETRGQPQLVEIAIEPKTKADTEKLVAALLKLAAEDPVFGMEIDRESGQTTSRRYRRISPCAAALISDAALSSLPQPDAPPPAPVGPM